MNAVSDLWHGFLPNVRDTRIMSSYVDENRRGGLKGLSSEILGYEQESYDEVTKLKYLAYNMPETGREVRRWEDEDGVDWVEVKHKMNEITAKHSPTAPTTASAPPPSQTTSA